MGKKAGQKAERVGQPPLPTQAEKDPEQEPGGSPGNMAGIETCQARQGRSSAKLVLEATA